MILRKWEDLPAEMKNEQVRPYYEYLAKYKMTLAMKFLLDKILAAILLLVLSPVFFTVAIWIKTDSPGEVFFRQERVTRYGKKFRIYKFRTMVKNAEALGSQVTTNADMRVTKVGKKIRACRLDEIPQLINILKGEMSFVGTRPEVPRYVKHYTEEMYATLLLPAGVTSEASIEYKDEERLLAEADDADEVYITKVLPEKMRWNYSSIGKQGIWEDFKIILRTLGAVI
ncbi:sugar transferase [Selenomonas ruminis]|uniref:Sugar transferase n=1 Tax=Selenomonas ruminis TaxID=2593411 RepID=A0A5D6WAL9_9FIRM|nr:sugar transferase [Selenomonas sp. mPRGC5]TYZ24502.1 sugar transferase [Selenomonas sp. mPRGC5]